MRKIKIASDTWIGRRRLPVMFKVFTVLGPCDHDQTTPTQHKPFHSAKLCNKNEKIFRIFLTSWLWKTFLIFHSSEQQMAHSELLYLLVNIVLPSLEESLAVPTIVHCFVPFIKRSLIVDANARKNWKVLSKQRFAWARVFYFSRTLNQRKIWWRWWRARHLSNHICRLDMGPLCGRFSNHCPIKVRFLPPTLCGEIEAVISASYESFTFNELLQISH